MDSSSVNQLLDIVWIITAGALVFFMQAGFALLEAGMVRSKNAVNVVMKNYMDVCFGSLAFFAIGYGLMFGSTPTGLFGTDKFFGDDVSEVEYATLFFQMMFAATAATIMSGAVAERMRYFAYIASAVFVVAFIYPIYGGWVWGSLEGTTSGWLNKLGFIDFAGSSVVHSVGGWCALAGIVVLGPRLGRFGRRRGGKNAAAAPIEIRRLPGHNLPLVALGGFILWLGFFGFNAGSTLAAEVIIGKIALNTQLAGAAGVIGSVLALKAMGRPVLLTFTVNGGLGGLVAICAGADTMMPGYAACTGLIAGVLVTYGVWFFEYLKLDDAVGAVSVHGIGGVWGTLSVALMTPDHFFDLGQLGIQAIGVLVAFLWAFPTAYLVFKLINFVFSIRVDSIDEQRGLDFTEHYEIGYPEFQRDILHGGVDK